MKIGLFAGAFDPIHLGHTAFIARAIKEKELDQVYVLIERQPKFKDCIAAYDDRKSMAKLAIADIPEAELYESQTDSFPITSSLPKLRSANPQGKFFLLIGDDVARHINKWDDGKELLKDVELIIASRGGAGKYADVSSWTVRQKIQQDLPPELNPAVEDYIRQNRLY